MRRSTLRFASTKTYGPISIDLREKRRKKNLSLLSLSRSSSVSPFFFSFYFIYINIYIIIRLSLIRVRFCPEIIYLFSVQFILNELSSNHFLTSEIFVKISSQESLATYYSETRKNFSIVSKFDEIFPGH